MIGVVAAFIVAFTSSTVTSPSTTEVKIVVDPVGTGTRCAEPINLPFNSGITNPIAFAAPVELGTMLTAAARALLKSPFYEVHLIPFDLQCKHVLLT